MLRTDYHPLRPPRAVAVTGAGIITSQGAGWKVNAEAFRRGVTALRPVTLFDVSRQRVQTAGEVNLPADLPLDRLGARDAIRMDRGARLIIHAGHEALAQAGWPETARPPSMPVVLGTSAGAMAFGQSFYRQTQEAPAKRRGQTTNALFYQTQHQAGLAARALGIEGPMTIISNACAAGANAIAHGFSMVRHGIADSVMCGGYDALCQLVFAGFDSLKALSTTSPRPFDATRDGLALGEGAGVLVLETMDAARQRGAAIIAEITGAGAATDLHHLTQPHPQGDAAVASMNAACRMAGIEPQDIDYINSHGTGTPLNDGAEAIAIRRWAGESVPGLRVSSTKGSIGHLLGGAGAVEAVICLMALHHGFIPPNVPVRQPDEACAFDLVTAPRDATLHHVLTNSFGFGGSNATLVFSRAA